MIMIWNWNIYDNDNVNRKMVSYHRHKDYVDKVKEPSTIVFVKVYIHIIMYKK